MKYFLVLFIIIFSSQKINAQSMSCQELFDTVTEYRTNDSRSCYGSTMLARVDYYRVEGMGFVVAYIKQNDYDYKGSPYIFCGISEQRWSSFKSGALYGSWGESFHKYIRDYTCDCY